MILTLCFGSITATVLTILGLIIIIVTLRLIKKSIPPKALSHLKGPNFFAQLIGLFFSGLPGSYLQMRSKQQYGNIVRLYFSIWTVMIYEDDEAVKEILKNHEVFEKLQDDDVRSDSLSMFFGNNIVSENGEKWNRLRKICNPAFHWEYLRSFMERFTVSSKKVINYIETNNQIFKTSPKIKQYLSKEEIKQEGEKYITAEVVPLMQKLTLDILGDCAFSVNFGSFDGDDEFVQLYNRIFHGLFNPMNLLFKHYDKIPLPSNRRLKNDIRKFADKIRAIIHRRRSGDDSNPDRNPDLLDMLIGYSDVDGLTDKELIYNFNIFFLAGHDTTSTTLSMVLNFMALYPEIQDRVREEINKVLAGKDDPSYDDLKDLIYLTQVIKETMRFWPPVGVLPARICNQEVEVAGHRYPKGTCFSVCSYTHHHSPKYWENPDQFDPDRFEANRKINPYAYFPFGVGQRVCIGNNFSLQEQKVFLALLLRSYRIHPVTSIPPSKQQKKTGLNFDLPPVTFMTPKNLFLRFEKL